MSIGKKYHPTPTLPGFWWENLKARVSLHGESSSKYILHVNVFWVNDDTSQTQQKTEIR